MRISKRRMFTLMQEGYITLRIPTIIIGDSEINTKDMPDEWFNILQSGSKRPALGKEHGFLYFSKAGWKANKQEIKEVFTSSLNPRGTWNEFETHVKEHFEKAEESISKEIARLKKRLYELINFTL